MFSFINIIIGKIVSLGATAIIAIGLVSIPVVPEEILVSPPQEEVKTSPINDSLNTQEKTEIIKAKVKEIVEVKQENEPQIQIETIIRKDKPKTFTLPSGAIIDDKGNILNQGYLYEKNQAILIEQQRVESEAKESAILNQQIIETRL